MHRVRQLGQRGLQWVKDNSQVAAGGAVVILLLVSAIWLTAHQGEIHMRRVSELVHKYDMNKCEQVTAERELELRKAVQEKDAELAELRARAGHFENESKRLHVRLEESEKQMVAAQNERTVWQKEHTRCSSDLKKSAQLQTELMGRLQSNEDAVQSAQNLQKMFEAVKAEYDATSASLQKMQHEASLKQVADAVAASP